MHSLAEADEVIGFFSYSRDDDEDSKGALSELRDAIQRELGGLLGRSRRTLRLWQDKEAIVPGKLWEGEIQVATWQSVFFIPIITPRTLNSQYCKFEFDAFLARERALGRDDLVFPILYIRVPALEKESLWRNDPVLSVVGARQYVDWRILRQHQVDDKEVRQAVAHFCGVVADTLQAPITAEIEARAARETDRKLVEARVLEVEWIRQREADAERLDQERRASEDERLRLAAAEDRGKREAEAARLEQQRRAEANRPVSVIDESAASGAKKMSKSDIAGMVFMFCIGLSMLWGAYSLYTEYMTKPSMYTIFYITLGILFLGSGCLFAGVPIVVLSREMRK